jgi:cytochrome c oxidase assembly factor CtaG
VTTFTFDPFALALVAIASALYARFARGGRPLLFVIAMLAVLVALVSPIAFLARGVLFSAHMLQHLLLVLVVPPLVLLSLPHEPPSEEHEPRGLSMRNVTTWALGVGAMWIWHAPTLCNAASRDPMMLRGQTLSLLAMGAAFFWPIFGTRAAHRLGTFGALAYLFTACAACTVLGIAITFSPVEVCSVFAGPNALRDSLGMTVKSDQEVGGLLMWVPGCLIYAGCIVFMYGRYARGERIASHVKESS